MTALTVFAAAELVLIVAMAFLLTRQTKDYIALVDRLCQRLQSPSAAVMEHDEAVRTRHPDEYAPPAVEPDDDDSYWLSREKLAEFAMKNELDDRSDD